MRLTKKKENGFYELKKGQKIYGEENGIRLVQIVGEYEDTKEELNMNLNLLPTLLKIKKGDKIYVIDGTLVKAEVTDNSLVNGKLMVFSHYGYKGITYTPVCYYSEYGKTWALTKEELLWVNAKKA